MLLVSQLCHREELHNNFPSRKEPAASRVVILDFGPPPPYERWWNDQESNWSVAIDWFFQILSSPSIAPLNRTIYSKCTRQRPLSDTCRIRISTRESEAVHCGITHGLYRLSSRCALAIENHFSEMIENNLPYPKTTHSQLPVIPPTLPQLSAHLDGPALGRPAIWPTGPLPLGSSRWTPAAFAAARSAVPPRPQCRGQNNRPVGLLLW